MMLSFVKYNANVWQNNSMPVNNPQAPKTTGNILLVRHGMRGQCGKLISSKPRDDKQ
jgi:hypothetical protein